MTFTTSPTQVRYNTHTHGAKKKGYTVDPDDIDSKVASGPKKPSEGRTNSFTLKLKDNPKKMLAVQVYGMGGGKYELNTYIT